MTHFSSATLADCQSAPLAVGPRVTSQPAELHFYLFIFIYFLKEVFGGCSLCFKCERCAGRGVRLAPSPLHPFPVDVIIPSVSRPLDSGASGVVEGRSQHEPLCSTLIRTCVGRKGGAGVGGVGGGRRETARTCTRMHVHSHVHGGARTKGGREAIAIIRGPSAVAINLT